MYYTCTHLANTAYAQADRERAYASLMPFSPQGMWLAVLPAGHHLIRKWNYYKLGAATYLAS